MEANLWGLGAPPTTLGRVSTLDPIGLMLMHVYCISLSHLVGLRLAAFILHSSSSLRTCVPLRHTDEAVRTASKEHGRPGYALNHDRERLSWASAPRPGLNMAAGGARRTRDLRAAPSAMAPLI